MAIGTRRAVGSGHPEPVVARRDPVGDLLHGHGVQIIGRPTSRDRHSGSARTADSLPTWEAALQRMRRPRLALELTEAAAGAKIRLSYHPVT